MNTELTDRDLKDIGEARFTRKYQWWVFGTLLGFVALFILSCYLAQFYDLTKYTIIILAGASGFTMFKFIRGYNKAGKDFLKQYRER